MTAQGQIVVAVDGSERNRSAVAWASAEAAATGCELVLVTAVDDHAVPIPHFAMRGQDQHARGMLDHIEQDVAQVVPEEQVTTVIDTGSPVDVLLAQSKQARMLVVGKRGLGGFTRLLVGSTSIAVAGRAMVPVTIVPDSWKQDDHRKDPIAVGVDPHRPDDRPLQQAFTRAARLEVPLIAVHGWQSPTSYAWEPTAMADATAQWEREAHQEFDKVLDAWRGRFPDVTVEAVRSHSHPAVAILDASERSQLAILGRHTDARLGGFAFGSVTRAVLHYAQCPVTVVPTEHD